MTTLTAAAVRAWFDDGDWKATDADIETMATLDDLCEASFGLVLRGIGLEARRIAYDAFGVEVRRTQAWGSNLATIARLEAERVEERYRDLGDNDNEGEDGEDDEPASALAGLIDELHMARQATARPVTARFADAAKSPHAEPLLRLLASLSPLRAPRAPSTMLPLPFALATFDADAISRVVPGAPSLRVRASVQPLRKLTVMRLVATATPAHANLFVVGVHVNDRVELTCRVPIAALAAGGVSPFHMNIPMEAGDWLHVDLECADMPPGFERVDTRLVAFCQAERLPAATRTRATNAAIGALLGAAIGSMLPDAAR